ncbi:hypothetical protein [Parapedobacter koreensis]|uniref:Uncharacterized protein n=1 Tax=Parapedobacter koreensis TaxID=332977 RepID=A0A1H7F0M4_9SPHI|nr:hypothetical protein [Parapedobacter koreensis]SEK17852.1 hypothetical protein SAMN05421740_10141 [Parapedobacter koreensis]
MKTNRVLFFYFLVSILLVGSCKKDPIDQDDIADPVNKEYVWVDAKISLPGNVNYSLADHELNAVGEVVAIRSDGTTKVPKMTQSVSVYSVTNGSEAPVMLGFSTPNKTEISPEATAKVTLFTLYRIAALPVQAQIKFLEGFDTDGAAQSYISEFVKLWKTDQHILVNKRYVDLLKKYHAAYHKAVPTPSLAMATSTAAGGRYYFVEAETGELEDGYSLELEDPNKFYMLNKGPRTATAFIYKTQVKRNNAVQPQTLISAFERATKSDKQWFVENGTYIPQQHPFGFEVDYRKFLLGKTLFAEVKSGPHELPLADDEEMAEYTIRLVNAGVNVQEDLLTDDERAAYSKHMHAALIVDFYLPFMGINLGLDINDFYAMGAEERADKLDAAVREAGVHTLIGGHLSGGRLHELLKTLETYFQSESTGYGLKLHEAVFKAVGRAVPQRLAGAAKRNGYLSYYFDSESFWNTEREERLFMDYYWETYGLITLKATARAGVVRVSPRRANITALAPNNSVALSAVIETEEFHQLEVTYRWRTPGNFGSLSTDGYSGTSQLETKSDNVVYKADYAVGRTTSVVERVYVDVLKDNQVVGTDSAEITIGPSNYRIVPDGITLTGNGDRGPNIANLRIEKRSQEAPAIGNHPDYDFKVVWRTAGKHGGLRWDGRYASYWTTEMEAFNSANAQYRCSDEDVKESVEDVEATIFSKPKGAPESDYELVDIIKGSININNDENKRIIHQPMTYYSGAWAEGNWFTYPLVIFPVDEDAKRYSVKFYNFSGTAANPPEGATYTWSAGQSPPTYYAVFPDTKDISGGSYYVSLSRTWCAGPPSGCNAGNAAEWEARYREMYGTGVMAEIIYFY